MFDADLHIHSKSSRACSRDCDIPHLAAGALRKGISVGGTGDFTHPAWADELKTVLSRRSRAAAATAGSGKAPAPACARLCASRPIHALR